MSIIGIVLSFVLILGLFVFIFNIIYTNKFNKLFNLWLKYMKTFFGNKK